MIVGYARISSEEQAIDANALVKQVSRLRDAGAAKIFYDVAQRTNNKRKGLSELIVWVKENKVEKLIFTRLDRVSSSVVLFYQLADVCREHGVKMFAIDDPIDMDSVGGEMGVDVRLAVAKHEVKMLSLRVSKDIEARRKRHKPHYVAPFGYKVVGEYHDRYELDRTPIVCLLEEHKELTVAEVARFAIDTYLEIGSCRKTVMALHETFGITLRKPLRYGNKASHSIDDNSELKNLSKRHRATKQPGLGWSANGLQSWLHNPVLAGGTAFDNTPAKYKNRSYKEIYKDSKIVWGTHPNEVLITMLERQKIAEITARNRTNKWGKLGSRKQNSMYSGLIKCQKCGSSCYVQCSRFRKRAKDTVVYYQCNNYYKNRLCDNQQMINDKQIESQLIPYLTSAAEQLMSLTYEIEEQPESKEITTLRQQLTQMEAIPGKNQIIKQAIESIKTQIQGLQMAEVIKQQQSEIVRERFIEAFSDRNFWQSIENPNDKKILLNECISEIYVEGKHLISVKLKVC